MKSDSGGGRDGARDSRLFEIACVAGKSRRINALIEWDLLNRAGFGRDRCADWVVQPVQVHPAFDTARDALDVRLQVLIAVKVMLINMAEWRTEGDHGTRWLMHGSGPSVVGRPGDGFEMLEHDDAALAVSCIDDAAASKFEQLAFDSAHPADQAYPPGRMPA